MRKHFVCSLFLLVPLPSPRNNPPLLLRRPAISKTQIVFNYGANLWIAGARGETRGV